MKRTPLKAKTPLRRKTPLTQRVPWGRVKGWQTYDGRPDISKPWPKLPRKPRKLAKKTNSWYRKECVKIAKKLVKERDDYTCQKCEKRLTGQNCHASHVYNEGSHHGMSANPLNMKVLCYRCHINWWHKSPLEATEWFKKKFPERHKILKALSQKTLQLDWQAEYIRMKSEL